MEMRRGGDMACAMTDVRARLLEMKETLEAYSKAGEEAASVVELDQQRVGRLSRMDALQAQAMSQELTRRRALELSAVSDALQRIEAGDYGVCETCDKPINPKRLELDPTVRLCVDCASAAEA